MITYDEDLSFNSYCKTLNYSTLLDLTPATLLHHVKLTILSIMLTTLSIISRQETGPWLARECHVTQALPGVGGGL